MPSAPIDFALRGDHITLEALLKATHIAAFGEARTAIQQGAVSVNAEVDVRRGRKVRAGDEVTLGDQRVRIVAG